MKLEINLPIFNGFYGSILEDLSNHHEAAELFTQAIEKELKRDFKISLEHKELIRPRFYNFNNDVILVELTTYKYVIKELFELCLDCYRQEFLEYIKQRLTSYDGFTSFYSNTLAGWERYRYEFYNYDQDKQGAMLNIILDFYLSDICEYNENDLMEYANQNGAKINEIIY